MLRRISMSSTLLKQSCKIRACLFDLDGTMLHTDDLHRETWSVVLEHFGWQEKTNQKCNLEFYQKNISGYHNNAIVEKLLPKSLFPEIDDIYKVAELKEDLFRMAFKRCTYPQIAGLPEFFKVLDENKILVACVTNAPRINALAMLQGIGLSSRFNSPNKTLIIAEETAAPKPSPIPYLVGMQTLSDALQSRGEPALKPEECVVFEDSVGGIKAGVAAQMHVVAVGTSNSPSILLQHGCRGFSETYEQFTSLQRLEEFIAQSEQ